MCIKCVPNYSNELWPKWFLQTLNIAKIGKCNSVHGGYLGF